MLCAVDLSNLRESDRSHTLSITPLSPDFTIDKTKDSLEVTWNSTSEESTKKAFAQYREWHQSQKIGKIIVVTQKWHKQYKPILMLLGEQLYWENFCRRVRDIMTLEMIIEGSCQEPPELSGIGKSHKYAQSYRNLLAKLEAGKAKEFSLEGIVAGDIESSGFDPEKHGLMEVGLVKVSECPIAKCDEFHSRIKLSPLAQISSKALEANKLNPLEGESIPNARKSLVLWCRKHKPLVMLGQNWMFDISWLEKFLGEEEFRANFADEYIDTMHLASAINDLADINKHRKLFPKGVGLDHTSAHYGIDRTKAHTAIADAKNCVDLLRHLKNEDCCFKSSQLDLF